MIVQTPSDNRPDCKLHVELAFTTTVYLDCPADTDASLLERCLPLATWLL